MQSNIIQSANLHFEDGRSNKLYNAVLIEADTGYLVNFEYGRRGSTLRQGSKTTNPVDLNKAVSLFNGLVKQKCSKGYMALDELNTTCTTLMSNAEKSPYSPQLLNPIDDEELAYFVENPSYLAQEKFDGERRIVEKLNGLTKGINKKGNYISLNRELEQAVSSKDIEFVVDGEDMGGYIVVFDLIKNDGIDVTSLPLIQRLNILSKLPMFDDKIRFAEPAFSKDDKTKLLESVKEAGREGVVFKHIDSLYEPGRPSSGGNQRKFKFYATASCVVLNKNDKRSVELGLIDGKGELYSVGNVSIPANKSIPDVNSVIEVRYLYAYKGGSLFQPFFKELRVDVNNEECLHSQLKYKANTG